MKILAVALLLALVPSVAAAAGWFLVKYTGKNIVVAPKVYGGNEDCRRAGRAWELASDFHTFVCIPAP